MDSTEIKPRKLLKEFGKPGRNKVLLRLVLIKSEGRTYIYYGDAIFSHTNLKTEPEILYDKSGIQVLVLPTDTDYIFDLVQKLIQGGQDLFTPNTEAGVREWRDVTTHHPFTGKLQTYETEFTETYTQTAKKYSIPFPCKTYPMNLEQVAFNEWDLPYHRSLAELMANALGIIGIDNSYLRFRFNVHFEIGLGKLDNFRFDGSSVKADVIMSGDKNKYAIVVMLDDKHGNSKTMTFSDGRDRLDEHFSPDVQRAEVRLVYNDIIADKVFAYQETKTEKAAVSYSKEIVIFKERVKSLRSEIKVPSELEFCSLVDSRILEAESKLEQDPKDVLQALAEAMEYLCGDFFLVLEVEKRGIGLNLHTKMVRYWEKKAKRELTELKYQTGVRLIIQLGSLKKHNGYEPQRDEVKYLLLLAWRGYWEILKMLKEVQEKE